jgi:hypothetical protein
MGTKIRVALTNPLSLVHLNTIENVVVPINAARECAARVTGATWYRRLRITKGIKISLGTRARREGRRPHSSNYVSGLLDAWPMAARPTETADSVFYYTRKKLTPYGARSVVVPHVPNNYIPLLVHRHNISKGIVS